MQAASWGRPWARQSPRPPETRRRVAGRGCQCRSHRPVGGDAVHTVPFPATVPRAAVCTAFPATENTLARSVSLPPGPRTNRASAPASCACGRGKASTPFSVLTSRPPCTRWDRSYQTPRQAEVREPRPLTHEAPASRTEPQVLTRRCEASLCPVFSPPSLRPIVTFGILTPSGGWQREPEGTRIPPSVSRSHGGSALNRKQKLGARIPASLCTTRDFRGQVI